MNHSDNKGLVLPPTVAFQQCVIVPIVYKDDDEKALHSKAQEIESELKNAALRTLLDDSKKNPGWKFAEHELKGVPVRVELGPKDLENGTVRLVRRDTGAKKDCKWKDMVKTVLALMEDIQENLFKKAKQTMDDNIIRVTTWEDFLGALEKGKLVLAPSCNETESEDRVSERTKAHFDAADLDAKALSGKAKSLCIPLKSEVDSQGKPYQQSVDGLTCIESGKPATTWIL